MASTIASIFEQLDTLPVRQSAEMIQATQAESYFHLAAIKGIRAARLKAHFRTTGFAKVFLSANINGFDCQLPDHTVRYLEKGFFQESDEARRAQKRALLEDAVVIVNNNDIGTANGSATYVDFYQHCEKTVFVAWDWDNHHWLELSSLLAAHSDIYAPAHHENLYLLSRFNAAIAGPVYCSTVQWPRRLLADSLPHILTTARSNEPLGKHIPYGPFSFRNRVVSTLHQHHDSIGFSDRSFHVRTPQERLQEWAAHKLHWIVPVLNDVAIRIFDALSTGGIPIVPESMRYLPPICDIGRDHILFCGPEDIMNPKALVEHGNALFDARGADGMAERHRFALDNHHGDQRMRDILGFVIEAFGPGR